MLIQAGKKYDSITLEADGKLLQIGVGVAAVVDEAIDETILRAAIALLAGKIGEVLRLELALCDQRLGRLAVDLGLIDGAT